MGDINEEVGFNIRRIRERRALSQEELGALAGLHRAYVGQIERGEKNIGLKNLEKLARALNVPVRTVVDLGCGSQSQKHTCKRGCNPHF